MTAGAGGGMFDPDGPVAREIVDLWWLMVVLGVAVFVVFVTALVIGLLRRRPTDHDDDGPKPATMRRLVIGGGVVMPAVVLTVVLVFTVDAMRAIPAAAPPGALRVEIVGHQWWWEIRYPDHGVTTANELHLPFDRPTELRLTSADVIHSFWVPALGGKRDLLPDDTNTLVLHPTETGEHRSQCAEFCGLQHAKMRLLVVVEPQDRFADWLDATARPAAAAPTPAAARGQDVFRRAGCAKCHTIRGTEADGTKAPDLTHLARRRTIAGATLPLTRQHVARWITDPHSIKRGVDMPATDLDDDELDALLDYLEGLE